MGLLRDAFSWERITEDEWERVYRSPFVDDTGRVVRVFPGTKEYAEVVRLRYHGLIETGFIDPARMPLSSMELPRDRDSIILAIRKESRIVGTITLNTITPSFPGMAMELEKGVMLDHPFFRSPDVIELTKLVVAPEARIMKLLLNFSVIPLLLGRIFGKHHHWQVSRNIPVDTLQRERLGFGYENGFQFLDRSLNNMNSRVGYFYLPRILQAPRLLAMLRPPLTEILDLTITHGPVAQQNGGSIGPIPETLR